MNAALADYVGITDFCQAHACLRLPPEEKRQPRWIILHSTETSPGSGLSLAKQWAAPTAQASAHYIIDVQRVLASHRLVGKTLTPTARVIQCVLEHDVAYAATCGNRNGINIEFVGRCVAFNGLTLPSGRVIPPEVRTEWGVVDKAPWFADTLLTAGAELVADIAVRNNIEIRRLTPEEMLDPTQTGIIRHADVTKALALAKVRKLMVPPWYRAEKPPELRWSKSDHMDPDGVHRDWPWAPWLNMVARHADRLRSSDGCQLP